MHAYCCKIVGLLYILVYTMNGCLCFQYLEDCYKEVKKEKREIVNNFMEVEEDFFVFAPSKLESKKFQFEGKEEDNRKEEGFGDGCTVGSCTSKSSSEWRSSIKYSEDPFSSSSRRSCPTWESYAVFQKYDEEMLFLDRISVQKLHETGLSIYFNSHVFHCSDLRFLLINFC